MSEEESYDNENNVTFVPQKSNGSWKRKILTYSIIAVVAFATGAGIVGISLTVKENSPRKDLANTNFYLRNIFTNITISVFNSTSESISEYSYDYNNTAGSTFLDIGGAVIYNDEQENLEFMKIFFNPSATDVSIQGIYFRLNEKTQLNIIILADGREVYNALQIKSDIDLEFQLFSTEILVYVF
ncbi:MAG: hypothetical protein ACFFDW_10610 [Candidatus Thorarchaeota archaeon]